MMNAVDFEVMKSKNIFELLGCNSVHFTVDLRINEDGLSLLYSASNGDFCDVKNVQCINDLLSSNDLDSNVKNSISATLGLLLGVPTNN